MIFQGHSPAFLFPFVVVARNFCSELQIVFFYEPKYKTKEQRLCASVTGEGSVGGRVHSFFTIFNNSILFLVGIFCLKSWSAQRVSIVHHSDDNRKCNVQPKVHLQKSAIGSLEPESFKYGILASKHYLKIDLINI